MQPPSKRLKIAVDEQQVQEPPRGLLDNCTTPGATESECCAVVGGTETVRRINSVERVLCSQSLNTPPSIGHGVPGWKGAIGGTEDDFRISYSQSYTRVDTMSQQAMTPVKDDGGDLFFRVESRRSDQGNSGRRSSQATRKLFPIFRPKSQWKVLHIIRHAESEYNAATNTGLDFKDPQIFNPKLTSKGRRQATELRTKLAALSKLDGALWVSSPLTRAIETLLLSCPKAHLIGRREQQDVVDNSNIKVVIRPELTEHLVTTGDIGLPTTCLKETFKQLSEALDGIPERWWYAPESNDCLSQQFKKFEPKPKLKERVGAFRQWVHAQEEKVIVAYGHSSMIRELAGKSLRNCEILTLNM
ncbi:hypothetical protein COCOBI_10-2140 [Coccomyxa sp. Obi]|nr:hypothetical protein COCOBI_10-2140 [Coccomyxa sp. Obi]